VLAVEPHIDKLPPELAEVGVQLTDLHTALQRADVIVLLVDHKVFASVNRATLEGKAIIDTRGLWRQEAATPQPCVRVAC
jgi:UDP-N-acetyl-D-mannosaminuronic acid dehydrogenase